MKKEYIKLDEAAENYRRESCNAASAPPIDGPVYEYGSSIKEAFKVGAEWMARQRIKARCIESYNPISEGPDDWPHVVTLLYKENEDTPYIVAGDEIEIIIQKI